MTDRDAIIDNAKYLRSVRPIDPEEIHEYVSGQPHPAVVRTVLREEAVRLELREREDGTFVPVEDSPVTPSFDGVDRLPERYARQLESLLVERYGAGWPEGESGDELRRAIDRLKDAYYRRDAVDYDEVAALAYALYHLPDNYAVGQHVIARLARAGRLDRTLRVLDVGAGVGGPAAGIADLLGDEAVIEYHAVEPSPAADVLDALSSAFPRNVRCSIHREQIETFAPDGSYDLVLFANVLNELEDPIATLEQSFEWVADDGSVVAIAPADKNTSIALRRYERHVADEGPATVYSPTVRLWPHRTPEGQCWSFDVKPDLALPGFQRRLRDAAHGDDPGRYTNVDVQYSPTIFRLDGDRSIEQSPDRSAYVAFAESDDVITQRVDAVAVKLSHDLSEDPDANPLYLVGDGSQLVDHYAVCTNETAMNDDLRRAAYGDLLVFENVLVLWNDDEGAVNLVVDEQTVVDAGPAEGSPRRY